MQSDFKGGHIREGQAPALRGGFLIAPSRFIPGHAAGPPALGQNVIEKIIRSPWLPIGLEIGTGALLIALAVTLEDWAQLAALLGAGYWLYRAAAAAYAQLTPREIV